MQPNPTHISLGVLAIAICLLGTVSFVGARGEENLPSQQPVALKTQPLLPPENDDTTETLRDRETSSLVHPLIGTGRAALRAQLGAPAESYESGRFSFLTYRDGADRYQVVLDNDLVVEVSRIN